MMIQSTIAPESTDLVHGVDQLGEPFVIRTFAAPHRALLQRFYETFEPKRAAQGLPPAERIRIAAWLDSIVASGIQVVAFQNEELVGHGLVMPTPREGVGEYAVFLRADKRGRGIGTEVNRAVLDVARQAGLSTLWLTVEPRNRAAIRSYEKVGFEFVPRTIFSVEPEMEVSLEKV